MSEIDWSKAPGCYQVWIESFTPTKNGQGWHADAGDRWVDVNGQYWLKSAEERGSCKAHYRPSPAWSGEGKPPVGATVDCKCTAKTKARDWFPAEVKYISPYTVVLVDYSTEELDGEFVAHPATLLFQPRRTPEQIAEDEREVAIAEIEELIAGYSYRHCAEQIYKSGYRKQEKPE